MSRVEQLFIRTPQQAERFAKIAELADSFAVEAHAADEENRFSYSHIDALRSIDYQSYTVPVEWGGQGISLYEFVLYQERLAQGDAAIALGLGWHLGVVFDLVQKQQWPDGRLAELCHAVVADKALVNRAATEAASGSPARGGKPLTRAELLPDGTYAITGRKIFTTLSPVLDIFIITAMLGELETEFIVRRDLPGVSIDPTWKMTGMRGTASHDLVLDNVVVGPETLVYRSDKAFHRSPSPYLLHIPACYLGIAIAARREAMKFASSYHPNSLPHPILHTPQVGQQLGQIDLELSAARHFMYAVAARCDERSGTPELEEVAPDLAAVKVIAIQTALSVVDRAMRIVGAHSLAQSHPLQRMYRDVRFGLHNPPMEDGAIALLGRHAVAEAELLNRAADAIEL